MNMLEVTRLPSKMGPRRGLTLSDRPESDPSTIERVDGGSGVATVTTALGKWRCPGGNVMTKRSELDDLDIEVSAQQREENGRVPVTTIWKWNTPEEASAFLEGVEWVSDGALKAWIDGENPSDVLVHDDETIDDSDEWPIVRHGGE